MDEGLSEVDVASRIGYDARPEEEESPRMGLRRPFSGKKPPILGQDQAGRFEFWYGNDNQL
jgi:hypothetical protein